MSKVSWGILSTAKIGLEKVIPAMLKGEYISVNAIASRDSEKAKKAAKELGIPKTFGSYEELLADKGIEAVYISLPNHLHVEWTIKALQAGKHVLCEKPISMNYKDAIYLQNEIKKYPDLKVMEAFMYRHHPQWQTIRGLIKSGEIGDVKSTHSIFTYYNVNPADIRNQAGIGGGGLLDIGCYCISGTRFIFEDEPVRVIGSLDFDPKMKIDRLASGILEFPNGTATFMCSTQIDFFAKIDIIGVHGRLEIEKPYTPEPDKPGKITLKKGSDIKEIVIEPFNQYTIQGDLFSQAIINNTAVPTPFNDAVMNMKVIDGIFESSRSNSWIKI